MSSQLTLARIVEIEAEQPEGQINVLLADDHRLLRRELREAVEGDEGLEVLAEPVDLGAAAVELQGEAPHVLVLDLVMASGSRIDAIAELRERAPHTQIVVVTTSESPVFARRALAAGAIGLVAKELAGRDLPRAIRAAARGEQFLSAPVAGRLQRLGVAAGNDLSPRETEVLRLISLGHTSVEIARQLHLSPRTVETHRAHIHRKLGLATRAQLVGYALGRGLLGN
jgi:two-component system response regulator NreC